MSEMILKLEQHKEIRSVTMYGINTQKMWKKFDLLPWSRAMIAFQFLCIDIFTFFSCALFFVVIFGESIRVLNNDLLGWQPRWWDVVDQQKTWWWPSLWSPLMMSGSKRKLTPNYVLVRILHAIISRFIGPFPFTVMMASVLQVCDK